MQSNKDRNKCNTQCTVPLNQSRNHSNHERCTEEKRNDGWLSRQNVGGSSGCSSCISALWPLLGAGSRWTMAAVSGTEKPLSPVPCYLHPPPPGQSTKPLATGPPSRTVTAPPRLTWCAEVLLEPHLPWNTEKDGPASLGLGTSCLLCNRPGLGLALLQYECDDIFYDKPKLCTSTLVHRHDSHNYKCWVNPKACLLFHKFTPVVVLKIILTAIHMPMCILSFCFQPWGCPDCPFVLLRPLH